MTDRIAEMFEKRRSEGRKALITFVTAGDPDIETTKRLVLEMEAAGADLVELGVPFSDPVAEGPVIQEANIRALAKGLHTKDIFRAVEELRAVTRMPLCFLMYVNSIFAYGAERFFARCARTGIDGVIIPDLPYEEKGEFALPARQNGVKLISLVAPTSRERIRRIASDAEGFLYCVSSLGVTGMRSSFSTDFKAFFAQIDRYAKVPTALGFGISTPEQAASLSGYADGVIVGSAIVRLIGSAAGPDDAAAKVGNFVRLLRGALDGGAVKPS